jgi:hypothetical protein
VVPACEGTEARLFFQLLAEYHNYLSASALIQLINKTPASATGTVSAAYELSIF